MGQFVILRERSAAQRNYHEHGGDYGSGQCDITVRSITVKHNSDNKPYRVRVLNRIEWESGAEFPAHSNRNDISPSLEVFVVQYIL